MLALSAHKSAAGHAEPAAGLLGFACAALGMEGRCVPEILHLRSLFEERCHKIPFEYTYIIFQFFQTFFFLYRYFNLFSGCNKGFW